MLIEKNPLAAFYCYLDNNYFKWINFRENSVQDFLVLLEILPFLGGSTSEKVKITVGI